MTISLQNSVVYGPVQSRRLGSSLGINLLPGEVKFCLSDCIYCQYGRTDFDQMKGVKLPGAESLLKEIEEGFSQAAAEKFRLDSITFSGNGEPTLHPELRRLVVETKRFRDRYFPGIPISILSDSSQVHRAEVRDTLREFDIRYMKLDAGDFEMHRRLNPLSRMNWEAMVSGLQKVSGIILQSLFIFAPVNNAAPDAVDHWIRTVSEIKPEGIHVYTIARSTSDPDIKPASQERLAEIAGLVTQKTGIETRVI